MMFTWIGELLTTREARRRQKIYDEHASRYGISSALLVVREHLPSGKACLRMNIDATRVGNVARFINHSCDGGNLSTVLVRRSGALLPRLCFFASKVIQEGEELTFSYGEIRLRSEGLPCFCGSSCCFGILPSENTWWSSKLRVEQESIAIFNCRVRPATSAYPFSHWNRIKLQLPDLDLHSMLQYIYLFIYIIIIISLHQRTSISSLGWINVWQKSIALCDKMHV